MSHIIHLTYSKDMIRDAVFRFWWRSIGKGFFIALAIVGVSLIMALMRGDTSWVVGVMAASFVFGIVFIASLYIVHYRHAVQKLDAMGSPEAKMEIAEEGFTFSSGIGSATMPWSSVGQVWQFDKVWLLMFSKGHFATLPLGSVTQDERDMIVSHVSAAGGKIS